MRNRGSSLIIVVILVMLIGAMSAAFQVASVTFFRASSSSTDQQMAVLAAQSGASYYVRHVQENPGYFTTNPAPHASQPMGAGSFELESATDVSGMWKLVIIGRSGGAEYRLGSTIGKPFVKIPEGIVCAGPGGDPTDVKFTITNDSLLASYFPENGAFDPLTSGEVNKLGVNGSMVTDSMSTIDGDMRVTGTLQSGDPSVITGTLTENAAEEPVEDIDPYVNYIFEGSKTGNDNAALEAEFGDMWTPQNPSAKGYGSLIVDDGLEHTITAGVYRFRNFEVRNGSTIILDTSGGDIDLVYVGQGAGSGSGNDLTVDQNSVVKINPGGTENGVLTVLGENADFKIMNGSSWGQAVGDENNAGYMQIISLGGNGNSDGMNATGGSTVYGRIYAAAHELTITDSTWYGSAMAGEVYISNSTFAVDLGTLGVTLEAQSSNAQMLGFWDE